MREILFRGKTYDGEWEIGCLHYEYGETDRNGKRTVDYRILGMRGECRYVIPETVGQFTGVKDRTGKKIFEGDIVQALKTAFTPPRKYREPYQVHYKSEFPSAVEEYYSPFEHFTEKVEYEVIGNIHDNPELLPK